MQFTENKFQLFLRSEKKHGCLKSCDSKYIIKNLASIKCCTAFLQEWNLSRWNLQYNHEIERRNQEFRQTSKMESFATIINGLWLLTILTKLSILDVCGGNASEIRFVFEEPSPKQSLKCDHGHGIFLEEPKWQNNSKNNISPREKLRM